MACVIVGRAARFFGSVIGLSVFGIAVSYLAYELVSGPILSGSLSEPAVRTTHTAQSLASVNWRTLGNRGNEILQHGLSAENYIDRSKLAQSPARINQGTLCNMITDEIRKEILFRLGNAEREHGVKILLAIESGSRAWGFASPNSDYDVRFIYMREPAWYQAVDLEERRDVIEYEIVDEIDLNGWDLRKALRLYWKSNPTFVEWIKSPITYIEHGEFRAQALNMLSSIYSPIKGIYHYRSMAKTTYRAYLREEKVSLKKYFYALRPLLAARWLTQTGEAAPIEFEKLLALLENEPAVLAEVRKLLAQKRNSPELGLSDAVPILNKFIEAELNTEPLAIPKKSYSPQVIGKLNETFHAMLRDYGSFPMKS